MAFTDVTFTANEPCSIDEANATNGLNVISAPITNTAAAKKEAAFNSLVYYDGMLPLTVSMLTSTLPISIL